MTFLTSSRHCFFVGLFIVLMALLNNAGRQANQLIQADLPNPDSYYKLALLNDADQALGWAWSARDNAPHGFWMHWSEPHSQTLKAMAQGLQWLSVPADKALLWAGGLLTLLSMLLLAWPVLLLLSHHAGGLPTLLTAIAFATSIPLFGYGQLVQITHHIFMLVPLAWALLSLHGQPTAWRDARAGALLGMALWISPETMPFVLVVSALRAAQRLMDPHTPSLWAWALALSVTAVMAYGLNPPAPSYNAWTLDHISLAWLLFAMLVSSLMLAIGAVSSLALPLRWAASITLAVLAAAVWLHWVPEARQGAIGLLPDNLRTQWWARIHELKAVNTAAQWVSYASVPALATIVCLVVGGSQRKPWFLFLAFAVIAYGVLGLMHIRMGAAAALLACYALGLALGQLRSFRLPSGELSTPQQLMVVVVIALLPGQVYLAQALDKSTPETQTTCELAPAASALNALPNGTVLLPINQSPELLYRTHHRAIAGNYHHNIAGLSDYFTLWLGLGSTDARERISADRELRYVLLCDRSAEPSASVRHWVSQHFVDKQTLAGGWSLLQRSDARWLRRTAD